MPAASSSDVKFEIGYVSFGINMPRTPRLLRLDPMLDPLRNDSNFQRLVESPKPKRVGE